MQVIFPLLRPRRKNVNVFLGASEGSFLTQSNTELKMWFPDYQKVLCKTLILQCNSEITSTR